MEVRQALRDRSDLHPNTITYSVRPAALELLFAQCLRRYDTLTIHQHTPACLLQALISALGNQWEKAIEVFREQEEAARQDPDCVPNTITYSVRRLACL